MKLGSICTIVSGSTPKTSIAEYWDGTLNWITPAELTEDTIVINESQRKITQEGASSAGLTSFPAGTVILSSRAPIGKTAIAGAEMYCNQGFKNLICSDAIYNKYLFWFLRGKTDYLNSLGRGATFKEISKAIVEDIEIPLPPLETQRQIAAVLDKVSDLIALRKQQLAKLDELVKARFVEMFGDPVSNPMGWVIQSWSEVFQTTTGKLDSNAAVVNGEYPFFTCAKEWLWIDKYAFDCEALLLSGNNAAGVYDVKYYCGKFNAYQRTYVLRLNKKEWSYQVFKLQLENRLQHLQNQSKGTNTRYLTLGILNALSFIIPPVNMQKQFAAFVEQVNKSKATVQQGLNKLETLKSALMQEYFG